jgi:DNA-binding CsgD family transcriptional regulator
MGRTAMGGPLDRVHDDADFDEAGLEPFVRELGVRLDSLQHGFRCALDRLEQPVVLLATDGTVVFANTQALQVEAAGNCFQRRRERVSAVHPCDEALLQATVSRVLSATGADPASLALRGRDGQLSALLSICPIPPSVSTAWAIPSVAAAIFIRSLQPRSLPDDVKDAFCFTGAEFRLADLLLRGATLEAAALELGVSKNTTRSQLRGLFDKTGTRRQPELVALLHRAA